MGWLDKLLGRDEPKAAPEPVIRDGIHHEYFVADAPENGRWGWLGRVYDKDGAAHQSTGSEETPELAGFAARSWAADKKRALRGFE